MALDRLKTVRYPFNFGSQSDIVDATLTTIGTANIFIAENSALDTVSFQAVQFFCSWQDTSTVTGATLGEFRAALTLAGSATSTFTELDDLTNSGENEAGIIGPIDFTSYFNSNFGVSTSKACQFDVYCDVTTGTGVNSRGVYGWIDLTYTYSSSATDRTHTVCIPLDSPNTSLPTAANSFFGWLPQMRGDGGFLSGYSSNFAIRNSWLVLRGNVNANNVATDVTISWGFNGTGGTALPTRENALASDTFNYFQVNASVLGTATSNRLDLWTDLATRYQNLIVDWWITFTYTGAGTTSVFNYIELPIEFESPIAGTTSAVNHRFDRTLILPESGISTTLQFIGAEITYNAAASATPQFKGENTSTYRAYAMNANFCCGCFGYQLLLDRRSSLGIGQTLVTGSNNFGLDLYRSAGAMSNVSGVLKIGYVSDPFPNIDDHSHVVRTLFRQIDFTATADNTTTVLPITIPESSYWLQSMGIEYHAWIQTALTAFMVQARVASDESPGSGWRELYGDQYVSDNELAYMVWRVRARDEFKRFPGDIDSMRLGLQTSRGFRTTSNTAFRFGGSFIVSYYAYNTTVSGTISGSSGGTVNLSLHDADNDIILITSTRSGNGSYSFTVYNPVGNYYVTASESLTKYGASKTSTPGSDFNILMSPITPINAGYYG